MRRTFVIALCSLAAGCLGGYQPGSGTGTGTGTGTMSGSNNNGSNGNGNNTNTTSATNMANPGNQPPPSMVDAGVLQAAPPPTSTAAQELVKFGNCMQLADWNSTGMKDVQNQTTIGEAGECYTCHQTGMYNVALTKDANNNFNLMHTMPWLLKFAQATTDAAGNFQDITPTERIRDRGSEAGHPVYTLSTTRQQALDNFFQQTYTHYKAGNCTPPAAAPVPDGGV
jgi:hypothetical protein